jgi:hypothetical protein
MGRFPYAKARMTQAVRNAEINSSRLHDDSLRFVPETLGELAGRFHPCKGCGLAGPCLHPFNIARLAGRSAHRGCQVALRRIGSGGRRPLRNRRTNIGRRDAATGAPTEHSADHRLFGRCPTNRLSPRRMDLGLRAPEKPGADLNCAGAERERRGYAPAVGDATKWRQPGGSQHRRPPEAARIGQPAPVPRSPPRMTPDGRPLPFPARR